MYCVILGAGVVGSHMAEILSGKGHRLSVVDRDRQALRRLESKVDFHAVPGISFRKDILEAAGAGEAELVLCVTDNDADNILAAMLCKKMGAGKVIARVRSRDFIEGREETYQSDFNIDSVFCPETLTAEEIAKRVRTPGISAIEFFAGDRVHLREFTIREDSDLIGVLFRDLDLCKKIVIPVIYRGSRTIIPNGNTSFAPGDSFLIVGTPENVKEIGQAFGDASNRKRNIMVFGGGSIGYQLSAMLEKKGFNITLVEPRESRCRWLSEKLDRTLVLNGSAMDPHFFDQEGIRGIDTYIAARPEQEENIVSTLIARERGVEHTAVLVDQPEFLGMVRQLGIDTAVSPRHVTAGVIVRSLLPENIRSIAILSEFESDVLEIKVRPNAQITQCPLKDASLPNGVVVAAMVREDRVIIPTGEDTIAGDDTLILFTLMKNISVIEKLF